MKNKKVLKISLTLFVIILVCLTAVFAHPGRTDSNGGHWDRKDGTYHFHTGEYSGRTSNGSSSEYEYVPFTPPYEPPTDNPYRKDKSNSKNSDSSTDFWDYAFITICILIFGVPTVASACSCVYDIFLYDHLPKHKIDCLTDKISEYHRQRKEHLNICVELLFLSTNVKIPNAYEIGADNLPKDKNSDSNWGKSFTMYKTPNGKKLHAKYKCCSATQPRHIYRYLSGYNLSDILCSKCTSTYTLPDLSWYEEYRKSQYLEEKQIRIEYDCQTLRKEINILHKKCNSTTTKILLAFSKKNRSALHEANALYNKLTEEL